MMRLFFNNLIDYAATVITADSEQAALPAVNVANALRKRVWASSDNDVQTLRFDLGTAKAVTSLIVLDHNASAAGDELTLYSSPDNSTWTQVSQTVIVGGETTTIMFFGTDTKRYWKIDFTLASSRVTTVGRVFLGTYYECTEQPDYDGVKWTTNDPSVSTFSAGGQQYTDVKEKFDTLDLTFSTSPGAQVYQFESLFALVGISTPFFVQLEQSAAPFNKVFYCTFAKSFQRGVKAFDGSYFWDSTVGLREQI